MWDSEIIQFSFCTCLLESQYYDIVYCDIECLLALFNTVNYTVINTVNCTINEI